MLLKKQKEANLKKELQKKNTLTVKKSDAMKESELHTNMRRQPIKDQTLSAEAHLSLALKAMPFEMKGTALPLTLMHSDGLTDNSADHDEEQSQLEDGAFKNQQKRRGEHKSLWKLIQSYVFGSKSDKNVNSAMVNATLSSQKRVQVQKKALYHLEEAAEMGNSQAQNMLANILASGILPFDDYPEFRRGDGNGSLEVQADFAEGSEQLARAIMLWHLSAMDGNIEASITLGYRHYISATSGSDNTKIIMEEMANNQPGSRTNSGSDHSSSNSKKSGKPMVHSPSASAHYGVLGTCESSLAYYEAAAHAIMDELETSPLRGKVTPARDHHKLAEIHQRGTSSRLAHHNKPDELDEAITYYKMRANNPQNPDISAAYKVANMYHYGLRGVKQDMREALKYYEIAGDLNSWEAGGQAGKFHLWGMGLSDEERNMNKALEYFKRGTPGGLVACRVSY